MEAKLRPQTVLQQLLEEINFQRTKEMRQMMKDDSSGFVVLQGTTYWTELFVRHFLDHSEADAQDTEADDIVFFVRKKHVKGTTRTMPKYDTEVDVYRKDSRKLPIGDPDVDWEETVYLNLIIHQFNYTLTLAICTRTSPKELQVLRRHSQRVYASPSRRKMDTKGDGEEMTFPHICFMVDNFDEVFSDIMVRDGEMVCVELVASDRDGTVQGVIFLGSIRYDALKKVYDSRQSSLGSKVAQRMTFGLFSAAAAAQRCEFVRMKGPQGKGHAEMAVTKPKGSGVETPTSEPGFCATDMWDEWEQADDDDPDGNYYANRHQRRLSDPSANLNNFARHGWKAKATAAAAAAASGAGGKGGETVGSSAVNDRFAGKARSQNEGLDSIANELSEVEAGDLRDDPRPASSVRNNPPTISTTHTSKHNKPSTSSAPLSPSAASNPSTKSTTSTSTKTCCPGCFTLRRRARRLSANSAGSYGCQMNELMVCRDCGESAAILKQRTDADKDAARSGGGVDDDTPASYPLLAAINEDLSSPACLATMPLRRAAADTAPPSTTLLNVRSELEMLGSSQAKNALINATTKDVNATIDQENNRTANQAAASAVGKQASLDLELEIGGDVSAGMTASGGGGVAGGDLTVEPSPTATGQQHAERTADSIRVHGTEEQPAVQTQIYARAASDGGLGDGGEGSSATDAVTAGLVECTLRRRPGHARRQSSDNGNAASNGTERKATSVESAAAQQSGADGFCTLPRVRRAHSVATANPVNGGANGAGGYRRKVPMRTTPDGTNIYYWCEMSKRAQKELDDGAYNPLWTSRGFTQTFHFWKEHRRQQSAPLNAFLTYVTLPWWSIAKDLLDHRETPILTF